MKTPTQLAKQFFQEVWSPPANHKAIDELMTEDYEIVSAGKSIKGRENFKEWIENFHKVLLNPKNKIEDIFEDPSGNKVVSRWTCSGINNGIFDLEPNQEKISFTGIAIWEVKNGRLSKCWVERSALELVKSLTK